MKAFLGRLGKHGQGPPRGTLAVASSFLFGQFLLLLEPATIFKFPGSSSAKSLLTFPEIDTGLKAMSPHYPMSYTLCLPPLQHPYSRTAACPESLNLEEVHRIPGLSSLLGTVDPTGHF